MATHLHAMRLAEAEGMSTGKVAVTKFDNAGRCYGVAECDPKGVICHLKCLCWVKLQMLELL